MNVAKIDVCNTTLLEFVVRLWSSIAVWHILLIDFICAASHLYEQILLEEREVIQTEVCILVLPAYLIDLILLVASEKICHFQHVL